ncbi:MAG: hypothetical protein GWN07_05725, partial [Actinobacteria bacterium]|nr:hypothetical protein [Actinomycetota bacterium]NIU64991.1 hypothetical protein [Actinomycetota bacterium]NIV86100.1 hypothetical protein [Actinomycetota bacterium]NIW26797.1 hypothetical protein [Actinomycetota bacterium]NIX19353.1 hypothetical protein [Actinomycetota bacterium]
VTLTATDAVGNTTTETVIYNVAYALCLQYDPLKETAPGAVVPIKLFLCDGAGNNLSSNQIDLRAVGIALEDGTVIANPPNDAGKANTDPNLFRFRNADNSYIYNFDSDGIPAGFHGFQFIIDGEPSIVYRTGFTIRDG